MTNSPVHDYIFKKGDYVKIHPIFHNHPWYTNKIFKIVSFIEDIRFTTHIEPFYVVKTLNNDIILPTFTWDNHDVNGEKYYEINFSIVIQDNICLRRQKLIFFISKK
jgi:hypothetical protein